MDRVPARTSDEGRADTSAVSPSGPIPVRERSTMPWNAPERELADFNTPASSLSGAFHGMVLRSLTGIGPEGLTALVSALPSSLVLAGTRSIDAAEQHQLAAAGVEPLGMRALAHLPPPPPPGTRPRRLITPPAGWSWLPVA